MPWTIDTNPFIFGQKAPFHRSSASQAWIACAFISSDKQTWDSMTFLGANVGAVTQCTVSDAHAVQQVSANGPQSRAPQMVCSQYPHNQDSS